MIEIYSKENCGYCIKLKELMNYHGIEYIEKSLSDGKHTKEEIQERVPDKKINVVPQVFVNGEYLGGYVETLEFIAYDRHLNIEKDESQLNLFQ